MTFFKDLNLREEILQALEESGYQTPTSIQKESIPIILQKKDLCASAPTGTGKTAAFILPVLDQLASSPKPGKGPRVLILVPTRELALQVSAQAEKYSSHMEKITTVCIYGGVPYPVQKKSLSKPYEILVATPGRLIDHLERGRIKLSRVEILILDEADRMLDMGFIEPVEEIASRTPKERQTLMFSATLKDSVLQLAKDLLKDPVRVTVTPPKETHENIEQKMLRVDDLEHKHRLLEHILKDPSIQNALIFTSTKLYADTLLDYLEAMGLRVAVLHGDIPQKKRTYTISQFRKGKYQILVATDVAARGIDIPILSHVINFDLPNNPTDYIHRIGRTGRAGATGVAFSFVSYKDMPVIKDLEKALEQKISFLEIPGLEPRTKNRSSDFKSKRSRGSRSNRSFRSENRDGRRERRFERDSEGERSARKGRSFERPDDFEREGKPKFRSENDHEKRDVRFHKENRRERQDLEGREESFFDKEDRFERSERPKFRSEGRHESRDDGFHKENRRERQDKKGGENSFFAKKDRFERSGRPKFRSRDRNELREDGFHKNRGERQDREDRRRSFDRQDRFESSDSNFRKENRNESPDRERSSYRTDSNRSDEGNSFFKKKFKSKKFQDKKTFGKNRSRRPNF